MSKKRIAVFSPEVAEKILKKLEIEDGFSRQTPIDPKKLIQDNEFHDKNAQIYKSESSEFIPPFGCLRVTGNEFNEEMNCDVLLCDKPDGKAGAFVFNGMYTVETGQIANCYTGEVKCRITQEISEGVWGPKQDFFVEPDGKPAIKLWGESKNGLAIGRTIDVGVSEVFPVELAHVGGRDGSSESPCTWRYDITVVGEDTIIKADVDIATGNNTYKRMNLGKYKKATHGLACYINGEISVFTSNEVPVAGTC